jgi:hypothetical protein
MKQKAPVIILLAFALLMGLSAVVLAVGGDEAPAAPSAGYAALGDETLCPDGAYQIFLPVVMRNSTAATEPPISRPPVVLSLDGASVHAGSDLRVMLVFHDPHQGYDVYLYRASLGYWDICPILVTDAFGSVSMATCHVPIDTVPCSYHLVSILAGRDPTPANHVGEGDVVEVLP